MSSSTSIARTRGDDATTAAPAPDNSVGAADDVVHIVGWWQALLGDVLRLKVPRALCGESLECGPAEEPNLPDGAPLCPRCVWLNGGAPGDRRVPSYWVWRPDFFSRRTR
jgi:hypothetical protein